MQQAEALAFAKQWAAEWSNRDVAAVLSHFADEIEFTSPIAYEVVGNGTVIGKSALAEYWHRALTRIPTLKFTVDSVLFDPQAQSLAILYVSQTEAKTMRATEIMQFGQDGKIIKAEALYGAPVAVK